MQAVQTLERAKQFLTKSGRDIEQAQFSYHFEGGSVDDVLAALAKYQNEDGGFHGLEIDIAAPQSNPFATELALAICQGAQVSRESALLQRTVAYLERTQDDMGNWRFAPEIYQHSLPPWFQGWEWPNLNPSCVIASWLRELGVGSEQLHARVERLFAQLAKVDDLLSDEFYSVRPYAYYFLPKWQHPQRDLFLAGVVWWLIRQQTNDALDGNHFFQYVHSPESDVAKMLPATIIAERLDALAAEQQEDGGWPTPYDERWRSTVTMQNLLILRTFGRV